MIGKIFVISAPSGTGKTTIQQKLINSLPYLKTITTFTTRKPRNGEKEGIDYNFVSIEEFKKMVEKGQFLEYANVYGNFYGTPKKQVEEAIKTGENVLLVIDTQGGMSVKKIFPDAILIGILPPSIKEQEKRLRKRGDLDEEEIGKRIESAKKEREILINNYDYIVINKEIEKTVNEIKKIIEKNIKKNN